MCASVCFCVCVCVRARASVSVSEGEVRVRVITKVWDNTFTGVIGCSDNLLCIRSCLLDMCAAHRCWSGLGRSCMWIGKQNIATNGRKCFDVQLMPDHAPE